MSDHLRFSDGGGEAVEVSRSLLVAAIVFFFAVVVFVVLLHLYAKWRWGSISAAAGRRARLARTVFGPDHDHTEAPSRGLDPAVLGSIPVRAYRREDFTEGIDCAVCLSELADGQRVRLLPKCGHGFHVKCVDMWFFSHSTCPLCRDAVRKEGEGDVAPPPEENPVDGPETATSNFPTNVLFWGNQSQMSATQEAAAAATSSSLPFGSSSSSKRDGVLVIDIPRRAVNADDMKSPATTTSTRLTPTPTRLASLRRFLSRENKTVNCSSSCSSPHDLEQAITGDAQKSNADF